MKGRKANWFKKKFDEAKEQGGLMDRRIRKERRVWKRQMSKLERREGKKNEIL